jgi:integrase
MPAKPTSQSISSRPLLTKARSAVLTVRKNALAVALRLRVADYEDSGLVFATSKGTPLDAQNIINRHFKPLLRHAGLPEIRWHDLRHTCATLLLSRGTHPTYVQKLLGHASVQLTLDRYSHWMPTMGKLTAAAMDDVLDSQVEADEGKDALRR